MARIWQSGYELNSSLELTASGGVSETTIVRSGTYSHKFFRAEGSSGALSDRYQYRSSNTSEDIYGRVYLYIVKAPDTTSGIMTFYDGSGFDISIRLTPTNTLQLYNDEDVAQIGSDSSALNTGQWYRIELRVNSTTPSATETDARIDGISFASGTVDQVNGKSQFQWGILESVDDFEIYFDDIAINDSSGSFQNSWPGAGGIVHLRPNAAGDNSDWTGSNTDIDEVTPDDATTVISSSTVGQIEDVNLDDTPAAIGSGDTINVVQVGLRFNQGSGTPNALLRIKASSGGTVEQSGSATGSPGTTWSTNSQVNPRNPLLTLYDLPGASTTPWTKADLDTAQIGVILNNGGGTMNVSTMWLSVDFAPAVATTSTSTTSTSTSTTSTSSSTSTSTTSTSTSRTTSTSTTSTSSSTSTSTSSTSTSRTTSTSTTSTSRTTSTSTTSTSSSTSSSTSTTISLTTSTSTSSSTTTTSTSTSTTSSSTSTTSSITTSTSTSISTSTTMTINYPIMVQKGIQ